MASSYVDYKGQYSRINDQLLTIIGLVGAAVAREKNLSPEVNELVEDWVRQSLSASPGMIELDLSGHWETAEGQQALVTLLKDIREKITQFGAHIPADQLRWLAGETAIEFVDTDVNLVLDSVKKLDDLVVL